MSTATSTPTSTDRIEKQIVIKAPRSRVWRAVSDHEEFGRWFGVALNDRFTAGADVHGRITQKGYEHLAFKISIERVEPERLIAWRWHPYAIDPKVDYEAEPTTLVVFELAEVAGGTRLTIVESGFDRIPLARRAEAFRANSGGWDAQAENIERYVLASL
jgi:uncharacterized protein YndB with AHSA1/START domain